MPIQSQFQPQSTLDGDETERSGLYGDETWGSYDLDGAGFYPRTRVECWPPSQSLKDEKTVFANPSSAQEESLDATRSKPGR